jgi:phosphate transport system permease protein
MFSWQIQQSPQKRKSLSKLFIYKTRFRIFVDKVAKAVNLGFTQSAFIILTLIVAGLLIKSYSILASHSLGDLLFSSDWKPLKQHFGFKPFILSTVYVTLIAVVIAVPICILASLYIVEYASQRFIRFIIPMIDILAGIPSVIFGICGVIAIVPLVRDYVAPALGYSTTGYCILSAGFILAVMIAPVIIHVLVEVLRTVPVELREASLSLGATRWETQKLVVLRKAFPGVASGIILGFSRAFGETIAVLMVAGNVVKIPQSVFDAGYPLPALIANNYGEMMSVPMYDSALMFSALLLLLIILLFNIISNLVLKKIESWII